MLRLPVPKEKQSSPAKKREETPPITKGNMQVRVVCVAVLVAVVFIVLGARLWYLQVLTGRTTRSPPRRPTPARSRCRPSEA